MVERENWTSRIGFVFAAVGSAVGLGNIWGFPFMTASNGGAAFLVVYLVAVFLIGFPTMLGEFVLGRRGERDALSVFKRLGFSNWRVAGAVALLAAFVTLAFYSVIGGWVISYVVGSVSGGYVGDATGYFGSIATGPVAVGAHALFMGATVGIVALGIEDGIERATKVMIPAIVLLLVGLAVWVATLGGAAAGYDYYLSPDLGELSANLATIIPAAVSQAFFTLSLGFGVMIAYASYLDRDDSLPADGGAIVIINTLVALLAGLVIFPAIFAIGSSVPDSGGAGTAFTALADTFAQLPGGQAIGFVFFLVLLLAALSSSISLLEAFVSHVVDRYDYARRTVAAAVGSTIFLLGVPTALDGDALGWYISVVYNLALPLSVLLVVLFVGWVAADQMAEEVDLGSSFGDSFSVAWLWWVRLVIPLAVGFTLLLGIQTFLVQAGVLDSAIILG
jgi:NSS family neurotransmitter:Na+ symporter